MPRSADYTIQGFLYQFNKTVLEILNAAADSEVCIEGIIEDIEVKGPDALDAIQCKYHEAREKFQWSVIYKPVLQMMNHFHSNPQLSVRYRLYAYFPQESGSREIKKTELEVILNSTDKTLAPYIDSLKGKLDIDVFLSRFSLEFGISLDELTDEVLEALTQNGIEKDDVKDLVYPNAMHTIAKMSIRHDPSCRTITKAAFLETLNEIKTAAITRWTLALKTRKKLLESARKRLKENLDKNARLRYFVISESALEDFESGIVNFVIDYLDKYHFKPAHTETPLFCLDTPEPSFQDIRERLHKKGIRFADGFIGSSYDRKHLLRAPLVRKVMRDTEMEFRVRLVRYTQDQTVLNEKKCHDLFIIGFEEYDSLDLRDINVERLETTTLQPLRYLLGVTDVIE
jgi:hypothetical protein